MAPQKPITFALPDDLTAGLQEVKRCDDTSEAEQIRRGIRMWLVLKGVMKVDRKRTATRKHP